MDYYLRGRKTVSDELIALDCEAKKQLVQTLIGRLKDPDNNVRLLAVELLAMFGPAAREAVPALIEVLNELRDLNGQAWPPDEQALRAGDAIVEQTALRHLVTIALEKIGTPEAQEAARSLVHDAPLSVPDAPLSERLLSEHALIRHAALQEIESLSPEEKRALVPLLLPNIGSYALDALRKIGRIAVPELTAALASGDPFTSAQAALVLGAIGPEAHEAIPLLSEALEEDPDINVRVAAASALGMIGPLTEEVVPALIKVMNDQQETDAIRVAAIKALGQLGPTARDAIPSLIDMLKIRGLIDDIAKFGSVGDPPAEALGKIGPEAIDPLGRFLAEIREEKTVEASHARKRAIYALGNIRPATNSVAPILIKELEGGDPYNHRSALEALEKIGSRDAEVVAALIRALRDPSLQVPVALLLAKIGPAAQEAVPAITQILQKIDPTPPQESRYTYEEQLRLFLCFALYNLSPDEAVSKPAFAYLDREAIPRHIEMLNEEEPLFQESAIKQLSTIGPLATPQLIGALKDEKLANGAVKVLGNIGPSAVPLLTEALKDDQWQVRFHALQALEKIGTQEARDAVKRFRECPNLVGAKGADSPASLMVGS